MTTRLISFNQKYLKTDLPDIRPGDIVRVYQRVKEKAKTTKDSSEQKQKERLQVFKGVVIARKHGKGVSATITVRKEIKGIGTERIFPLHSPLIAKIEIVKRSKVRRAKLYYLRKAKGKKARLKEKK